MIQIDPTLYWEFRARQREFELAQAAAMGASQRLEAVSQKIEETHPGVDFQTTYSWDDATCSLIPSGQDVDPSAKALAGEPETQH